MIHKHCMNRNMVRKPKNIENKKHTVGHGIYQETLKKVKKMHTVGPRRWR